MMDAMIPILAVFALSLIHALVLNTWKERWVSAAKKFQKVEMDASGPISVTMVVPVRNGTDTLIALLQDLHAQSIAKEYSEVLVVDDGSEDDTDAIVRDMARTWPQLKLLKNDGVGKKDAITTAVKHAEGEIMVLTDADARCGPERVAHILREMEADRLDLLLLPVRSIGERNWLGRIQEMEQAGLVGMACGEALMGRPGLANGANMAFKRTAFDLVKGYEGDRYASGDDVFLVQRMKRAGLRIGYLVDPEALVTVQAERTWSGFLQQRLRWAGKMRAVQGTTTWVGLLGLFLPWALLYVTCTVDILASTEGHRVETTAVLALAWVLWLIPAPALVGQVRATLGQKRSFVPAVLSYLAFTIYAPAIALLALFMKPTWKGRPVRR